jgi:hypothetical protein
MPSYAIDAISAAMADACTKEAPTLMQLVIILSTLKGALRPSAFVTAMSVCREDSVDKFDHPTNGNLFEPGKIKGCLMKRLDAGFYTMNYSIVI